MGRWSSNEEGGLIFSVRYIRQYSPGETVTVVDTIYRKSKLLFLQF